MKRNTQLASRDFFGEIIESEAEAAFLDGIDVHGAKSGYFLDHECDMGDGPFLQITINKSGDVFFLYPQWDGISPFRIDFYISAVSGPSIIHRFSYAVEIDGHAWHERTHRQAADQRARDRRLARCGILTIRFAAIEVLDDSTHAAAELFESLLAFERGDQHFLAELEAFRTGSGRS